MKKSENTIELETAKYENLDVWFKLKFFELNDNAKYKIIINNASTEDYTINKDNEEFTEENYINYIFEYEDNDDIVKAGTEETIYITVEYGKEVPEDEFVDNTYTNDNYMNISFSKDNNVPNPNTFDPIVKLIIMGSISLLILILLILNYKKLLTTVLVVSLFVPIITNAAELFKININANVIIQKKAVIGTFKFCGSEYQFEEGMSLVEWFESDYNIYGYRQAAADSDVLLPGGFYAYGPNGFYGELEEGDTYTCRNVAECVSPNAAILISENNETKLAKDIIENDSIMYYDFETNTMKKGYVKQVYKHKDATDFIRYTLEDGTYIEATDYHPIYTKEGWKSYTNRENYPTPVIGDEVKTNTGYKKIVNIETYNGKETFYDFEVVSEQGEKIDNYFANGILVHSAY